MISALRRKIRIRYIVAIMIMGSAAAALVTFMFYDKDFPKYFPPVVTLLGMTVTISTLAWPVFAGLLKRADAEDVSSPKSMKKMTDTVASSFAVAGPLLGVGGVLLDDKLGLWGFGLSVVLGLFAIPLLLVAAIAVLPAMRVDDDDELGTKSASRN